MALNMLLIRPRIEIWKQRLTAEFTVFLMEIPEGFAGVKDVRLENGDVRIVPR